MTLLRLTRHFLRFCVVILFSIFSTNAAFAVPMYASDIIFPQVENTLLTQSPDVGFAARAPPMAVHNAADQTYQTMMDVAQLGIEFLPVIGDTIAFADCGSEMSLAAC